MCTNVIVLLLIGAACVWIGYHHVHHLSARVPNYNLRRAHDAIEPDPFRGVPALDLGAALPQRAWNCGTSAAAAR